VSRTERRRRRRLATEARLLARVDPHFGFLRDAGFDAVTADVSSNWSSTVEYRSATGAVRVGVSRETNRVEVYLVRLDADGVPAFPIFVTDARLDWAVLDTVVSLRRPELLEQAPPLRGTRDGEVAAQLAFWSRALREAAADFVAGGFAPIDEAGELVRRSVADRPQEVRVSMPADATDEEVAAQLDDVRASTPPAVTVFGRRYGRRRRRR
jgi:hypothetical protein